MSKRFGVRTWGNMFEGRLAQVASHLAFSAERAGKRPVPARTLSGMLRCFGAVYSITAFIKAFGSLAQIQQFAQHRSATCSMQGLSPMRWIARTARCEKPSRRGHASW
jgi:hypothetical protein